MSEELLKSYTHAMEIDHTTGKPMPKTVTTLTSSKVEQQLTEADAVNGTITFDEPIEKVGIYNTSATDGKFTVNGIGITVPAGRAFEATIGGTPSAQITITGATTYIVTRYK